MKQNSLDGSVPARLDIGAHKLFWTYDILFIIDLRLISHKTKSENRSKLAKKVNFGP